MAAFTVKTEIIHGDRPKLHTYQQLDTMASAADLDLAIEAQVCRHQTPLPNISLTRTGSCLCMCLFCKALVVQVGHELSCR